MYTLILMAFAVASLSVTATRSSLTLPVRVWATDRAPMLLKLLGCPYCISHWAAFCFALFVERSLIAQNIFVDFVMVAFCLVGMSAVVMGLIFKLLMHQEAEIEKMRDALIIARKDLMKK